MRLLSAADRTAVPWKNGGGVTHEVAAWPEGAGFDNFLWRVSMAEVATDGPFSVFPGVDRLLAVLRGRLSLTVADAPPLVLEAGGPPAAFAGDAATTAQVLDGPVLDLNLMSRRDAVRASLASLVADLPTPVPLTKGWLLALAVSDGVRLRSDTLAFDLQPFDAVVADAADGRLMLEAATPTPVYVARLEPF